jgi:hypothetical protein
MRQLGSKTYVFIVSAVALVVPQIVSAAPFVGPLVPQTGACSCPGSAPSWGCIFQTVQTFLNFIVYAGVLICVLFIAYGGFSLIVSGGNPEGLSTAKTRITNAIIGIVVILCAWLTVDFVMKVLYNPNTVFDGQNFGPWNALVAPSVTSDDLCLNPTDPIPLTTGSVAIIRGSGGQSGGAGVVVPYGGGTCVAHSSGACAASNMSAFGGAASQASQICQAESTGRANAISTTDRLGDGTPYSFGLFQINITAHSVGGLPCPNAFSKKSCTVKSCGPGTGARVVNADLYNKCAMAAKNIQNNVSVAAKIYRDAGNRWRPWGTARKCGLALGIYPQLSSLQNCKIGYPVHTS